MKWFVNLSRGRLEDQLDYCLVLFQVSNCAYLQVGGGVLLYNEPIYEGDEEPGKQGSVIIFLTLCFVSPEWIQAVLVSFLSVCIRSY